MDGQVGQSLGPKALGIFHQGVDLLSGHAGLAVCVDAADRTAVFQGALKHHKFAVPDHVGHIFKLHSKPQIRLIRAEAVHGLSPGHSLDGKLHVKIADLLEDLL